MKRILFGLIIGVALILSACGSDNDGGEVSASNDEERVEAGETKKTEDGEIYVHKRWDEGKSFESGPIILTVDKVGTVSGEVGGDTAALVGSEYVEYIEVELTVENTSDDDITFYAGQGTIVTSTGEQLESDILIGDHIEGDLLANTIHSGSRFYFLENSKAEDIDSIRMVFSAPYDTESYDDVGEKLDFEITLD